MSNRFAGAIDERTQQEVKMRTNMEPVSSAGLPYLAQGQKLALATVRLQAQTFRSAMRFQIELLGFLKNRFEQDVKFVDELVASSELNDAFDVVADFMQKATAEYASEAGKMASIGSKLTSEAARKMREQAKDAVEDLAAATIA
jgi:hypothetical protein